MNTASSYGLPSDDLMTQIGRNLRKQNVSRVQKNGRWAIRITRHFYGPEDREELLRGTDCEPWSSEVREFDTRKNALEHISERESGTYYLGHNECSHPTYKIVQVGSRKYKRALDCFGF